MNIIVCVKRVLDPRLPPMALRSYIQDNQLKVPGNAPFVLSTFDEYALELALRVKDQTDAHITVITFGSGDSVDILRHSLAMGADDAILVEDVPSQEWDCFNTANILSKAVQKCAVPDLILCGRQAADWDSAQVGQLIGLNLDIPCINVVRRIEIIDNGIRVERTLSDGYEILDITTSAVLTVGDEVGEPRLRSGLGTIKAARAEITKWSLDDIRFDMAHSEKPSSSLVRIFLPESNGTQCDFIEGESPEEMGEKLADTLRENNVI